MPLPAEVSQLLLDTVHDRLRLMPRVDFIQKLERIDKACYLEEAKRKDADEDSKDAVQSSYAEMGVGIVNPAIEAETSFMQEIFLSDPHIFSPVSDNKHKEIAQSVQAKNLTDAKNEKWARNFMSFFRSSSKYNLGVLHPYWRRKKTPGVKSTSDTEYGRKVSPTIRSGNSIKYIDPYNFVFDDSVSPVDIPEHGEWAGWIEYKNQTALYELIQELKEDDPGNPNSQSEERKDHYVQNITREMWVSSVPPEGDANDRYYQPDFLPTEDENTMQKDRVDWLTFAGADSSKNREMPLRGDHYHVMTLFLRMIPSLYEVPSNYSEQEDGVQIWKLVIVNSKHLIYAGPTTNAHGMLPFGIAQPTEDSLGWNSYGFAHHLLKPQKLAKELVDRRLASLDRNIEDRAIYNSNYIDGNKFKKRQPTGKIPVKGLGEDVGIEKVYYQIPFQDTTANLMREELSLVMDNANELSGQNAFSRGQNVKGNRTKQEFTDIMSRADSKQYARAVCIELQAFQNIKTIIKWNLVQYGEQEDLYDPQTRKVVQIDPSQLTDIILDFTLADGLNPASKYLNPDMLNAIFTLFAQFPKFNQTYDISDTAAHLLQQTFGLNMEQYKWPEGQAPTPTTPGQEGNAQ